LRLEKKPEKILKELSLITGTPFQVCRDVYENQCILFILNFLEGKSVSIPFIGDLLIESPYDNETSEGLEAEVNLKFVPSDAFKRMIGDAKDGKSTEVTKYLNKKFKESLKLNANILDKE